MPHHESCSSTAVLLESALDGVGCIKMPSSLRWRCLTETGRQAGWGGVLWGCVGIDPSWKAPVISRSPTARTKQPPQPANQPNPQGLPLQMGDRRGAPTV